MAQDLGKVGGVELALLERYFVFLFEKKEREILYSV